MRDYDEEEQIGQELSPQEYIEALVRIFRRVRRVLRDDGTLWVNIGDSYARSPGKGQHKPKDRGKQQYLYARGGGRAANMCIPEGLKEKDLIGIPWLLAAALRADGWYLRQEIIWSKPNPMPEPVRDRCTRSHEFFFMLSKQKFYYYDVEAIKEPISCNRRRGSGPMVAHGTGRNDAGTGTSGDYRDKQAGHGPKHAGFNARYVERLANEGAPVLRNKRSVWVIPPKPFKEAHFATFPPDLIIDPILAGSRPGGIVLDPFLGSGTTGEVALALGRRCIGVELNPDFARMAVRRVYPEGLQRSLGLLSISLQELGNSFQ